MKQPKIDRNTCLMMFDLSDYELTDNPGWCTTVQDSSKSIHFFNKLWLQLKRNLHKLFDKFINIFDIRYKPFISKIKLLKNKLFLANLIYKYNTYHLLWHSHQTVLRPLDMLLILCGIALTPILPKLRNMHGMLSTCTLKNLNWLDFNDSNMN